MRTSALIGAGVLALIAAAQPVAADPSSGSSTSESVVQGLEERSTSAALAGQLSVLVWDVDSRTIVYSKNADRAVLPASTLKVLTAVAALETLGPELNLETRVRVLARGHVALEGGGDPLLDSGSVDKLAAQTARWWNAAHPDGPAPALQVSMIDALFGVHSNAPGWPDQYVPMEVAPISSLGRIGYRGSDPAKSTMQRFVQGLRKAGVKVWFKGPHSPAAPGAAVIARKAHSVREAVRVMLLESDNNVAEALFKQVAVARGANPGNWNEAARAMEGALSQAGVNLAGSTIVDGSGLSRENRILPRALIEALAVSSDPARTRLDTVIRGRALPTAGESGTLWYRYREKPSSCARGVTLAKTGTLHDVISLAGVTTGADGTTRAFAIIVNDQPARQSDAATRKAIDGLAATVNGCWRFTAPTQPPVEST